MPYTNNLNLIKPDKTDQYNVADFNSNMDKIDNFAGLTPPKALTADKLTIGANINGILFDGSQDINISINWGTITGDLTSQTDLAEALDGDWVLSNSLIVQNVAIGTNSSVTVDLSNFLPEGNATYECIFNTIARNQTSGIMEIAIRNSDVFYTVIRHSVASSVGGNSNLVVIKSPFSLQLATTSVSTPVTVQEFRLSAYRRVH